MKKLVLFNLLCFAALMVVFLVTAFALGYAGGQKFGTDAGILYLLVVTLHLFANYSYMHRKTTYSNRQVAYASAVIFCSYALLLFHG